MDIKTKNIVSVGLALLSSIGTVATAYFAVKDSKKAEKKREELIKNKLNPTKMELVEAEAPSYIRSGVVGGITIASIIGSAILNKKAEVSLLACAGVLQQGYYKYSDKVKNMLGIDTHKSILQSISKDDAKQSGIDSIDPDLDGGTELYWIEHIGFFRAKPEDLMRAYADMNQRIHTVDQNNKTAYFCLIYDMLHDAKAYILNEKTISKADYCWGWTKEYLDDTTGVEWIHMNLTPTKDAEGHVYKVISFDEAPIQDASEDGGDFLPFDMEESTFKPVEIKAKEAAK